MKKWTEKNVLCKLKSTPGIDAFLELDGRGYLPIRIGKTSIFIFRESVGVSYYFQYPIESVEEAINVCDFMRHATPYLNQVIEQKRHENLLYKPQNSIVL